MVPPLGWGGGVPFVKSTQYTKYGTLHKKDFRWAKTAIYLIERSPSTRCKLARLIRLAISRLSMSLKPGLVDHGKTDTHVHG